VQSIAMTVFAPAPFDRTRGGRPRRRSRVILGVPWPLVLLHAAALIVSAMAGLALALFA
jgi:hypothetical protein